MAFDFPSTPNPGDLFTDPTTGAVYQWNGYAWIGGVTGIGLQTIKETRYLVAGAYTFTRDPKSSGFADIHLIGAFGVRVAVTWASGQTVLAGSGSQGTIGIKWKYALPASAPVVVGTPAAAGGASGASSFDTVLTAPGGNPGTGVSVIATGSQTAAGGTPAGAATGCDESYPGLAGVVAVLISGVYTGTVSIPVYLRGFRRIAANPTASGVASLPAGVGDPGAVCVVEYLNP